VKGCATPCKERDEEAEVPGRWARAKVAMGERGTPVIWNPLLRLKSNSGGVSR